MTDHHDPFPYEEDVPYEETHLAADPDFAAPDFGGADFGGADFGADFGAPEFTAPDPAGADFPDGFPEPGDPQPSEAGTEPEAQVPPEAQPPNVDAELAAAAGEEPVDVFPPAVDVGALPEPVDGFPWIDSGSLGLADIAAAVEQAELDPVQPEELAGYAAADLPPGVDPWAELAGSDDPATSNLARWWSQN